jgi:hypothetical protein
VLHSALADQAFAEYLYERRCEPDTRRAGAAAPRLRGAGYFASASRTTRAREDDADGGEVSLLLATSPITNLRREIERTYGNDYLAKKSHGVERDIRNLELVDAPVARIEQWKIPAYAAGVAERYQALSTASVALDVLLHDRRPIAAAYRTIGDSADQLSEKERELLSARAAALQSSLVRLASSSRHDWGYPMLVGMARLVALDASLRSGRLVIPDSFDDAAPSVPAEKLLADPSVVPGLLAERRCELDAARTALSAASREDEAAWSRLEIAANAMRELADAVERGRGSVRAYPDAMLPSRGAEPDPALPVPQADCVALAQWTVSSKTAADTLRTRLREVYRYDVVSRNCVTEIFRTMEAAGAKLGASADAGFGFIPVVSADAVNRNYPVAEHPLLPSYRNYWLARLRETDGPARTALRESNTITATLRHPDDRDDVFLFYTEDATVLRPLYGAVNTGVGAGVTLAGLVTWPFDHGRLLRKGARSFVFSVPELAFASFRKGRNGVLPRDWMQPLDRAPRTAVTATGTL